MAARKASSTLTNEVSPLSLSPDGPVTRPVNAVARLDRQPSGKGLAKGSITVNGHAYRFNSGSRTKYSVPQGLYQVNGYRDRDDDGFKRNGVGFSFVIEDINRTGSDKMFDKRAGRDRTLLRIHPDGGAVGSEGCIALLGSAATLRRFRKDMLNEISKPGVCRLRVV